MGLRDWIKAVRTEPNIVWVPGTFRVTAASQPAFGARMSSGWWTGELNAEGMQPTAITHNGIAPVDCWPAPGQVIKVSVVPSDTTLIKFDWASVPSPEAAGLAQAQALVDKDTQPDSNTTAS